MIHDPFSVYFAPIIKCVTWKEEEDKKREKVAKNRGGIKREHAMIDSKWKKSILRRVGLVMLAHEIREYRYKFGTSWVPGKKLFTGQCHLAKAWRKIYRE